MRTGCELHENGLVDAVSGGFAVCTHSTMEAVMQCLTQRAGLAAAAGASFPCTEALVRHAHVRRRGPAQLRPAPPRFASAAATAVCLKMSGLCYVSRNTAASAVRSSQGSCQILTGFPAFLISVPTTCSTPKDGTIVTALAHCHLT